MSIKAAYAKPLATLAQTNRTVAALLPESVERLTKLLSGSVSPQNLAQAKNQLTEFVAAAKGALPSGNRMQIAEQILARLDARAEQLSGTPGFARPSAAQQKDLAVALSSLWTSVSRHADRDGDGQESGMGFGKAMMLCTALAVPFAASDMVMHQTGSLAAGVGTFVLSLLGLAVGAQVLGGKQPAAVDS